KKSQMVQQAKGAASKIVEEGKATAAAIRSLGETWAKAGDSARQIFVAQKLQSLVSTMMDTVGDMTIQKVTVIDKELSAGGSNLALKATMTNEQLKQMLGVDLAALAQRLGGQVAPAQVLPSPIPRVRPPTEPGLGSK
ncbi:MAG TPA: flotillin family protein, partial [Kofleriaceae bacterium]